MSIICRFELQRDRFTLNVDLELPPTGLTVLFGRSGSGKTSLLRCIAGLEKADKGYLSFKDQIWQEAGSSLPVYQRPLGYVFQEASLFPHLTVKQNLEFGLKRVNAAKRSIPFDEVVELLGLEVFLARYPQALSGGQRQRVALGCALLTSPELLLMDEPMASLDSTSKEDIMPYLERLKERLKLPIIYVTHSFDEVTRLADHLVLLDQGRVTAEGSLQGILTRPDLPFVSVERASSVMMAEVNHWDVGDGLAQLSLEGQTLLIGRGQMQPATPEAEDLQEADRVRVRIMARDVILALGESDQLSLLNRLKVTVLDLNDDPHPSHILVRLALGQQVMLARVSRRSVSRMGLAPGLELLALIKGAALGG